MELFMEKESSKTSSDSIGLKGFSIMEREQKEG